jgi:Fic family protein
MANGSSDAFRVEWPATGSEEVGWHQEFDPAASRRAQLRARGPYDAAVPPAIAHQAPPRLDAMLAAAAEDAVADLARFDAELGTATAPFAAILLRSESASSSEIERLTAGPRGIALAELGRPADENAKLIAANVRAMEAAIALAGDLSENSIIEMQRVLLEQSRPDLTGSWRHEPVWIGGLGNSPHGAQYVAPQFSRVPGLMTDLVAFARRTDWPVVPQIAIAHAQFETVHPFPDGNGRTGRALIQSMLHRFGVTANVTVPVSAGLLQDTERYFAALTSIREGDAGPIIVVFVDAIAAAISNGRQLAAQLDEIARSWATISTSRVGSAAARTLPYLLQQPVVSAQIVAATIGVSVQNAQAGIDQLVEDGVLTQIGQSSRNRIYEARTVIEALDDFARRARRRRD